MGILCGLSSTCLSNHNNDLVLSKLGWVSDTWGTGAIALTNGRENSPFDRIHPFARTLAMFYEPQEFYDIEVNVANE